MTIHTPLKPPLDPERHAGLWLGWRRAVVAALGLDDKDFVLIEGASGRGTLSEAGLTALADMVPPDAFVAALPDAGAPSLWAAYRRLLASLGPETEAGLRGLLGPAYADWLRFRNAAPAGRRQADLFRDWSARLPARHRALSRRAHSSPPDPVDRLRDALGASFSTTPVVRPDGTLWDAPAYGGVGAIAAGYLHPRMGGTLHFDSAAMSECESAKSGPAAGRTAYLPGVRDPDLQARFAENRLTVDGRIGVYSVTPVWPEEWYDARTVERARHADGDPVVWDTCSTAGRWSAFFGSSGLLRTRATHVVTVSDVALTLTSHAAYSTGDVAAVNAALHRGAWPFLAASGSPVGGTVAELGKGGAMTIRWSVPPRAAQCLGIVVGPA